MDGSALRAIDPEDAVKLVQEVKDLGPFASELVVIRGANAPDALPSHERRLEADVAERYGTGHTPAEVSATWRPLSGLGRLRAPRLVRLRRRAPRGSSGQSDPGSLRCGAHAGYRVVDEGAQDLERVVDLVCPDHPRRHLPRPARTSMHRDTTA